MISNDLLEEKRKVKIEKAVKALEIIKKRKEKQPISGVEGVLPKETEGGETADTPLPEENENGDAEEKYIMESLFEALNMPTELSILIPFDDAESYREKINMLVVILAAVREEAYEQGLEEGYAGDLPPKEEAPEPEKQIADAMGVKVPSIFKRDKKRRV